jgi:hypothetical protein
MVTGNLRVTATGGRAQPRLKTIERYKPSSELRHRPGTKRQRAVTDAVTVTVPGDTGVGAA